MSKIVGLFLVIVLFISINTLFFPVKIYQSIGYNILEYFSIDKKEASGENGQIDGYFNSGKECFYFNFKNGTIYQDQTLEDQFIEANKFFYVKYGKVGEKLLLYAPDATLIKDIDSYTYPYIPENSPIFFGIKTNGSGFFTYNMQGDLLFSADYTSIITSISVDRYANTLISLLDGKSYLYSPKKEILFSADSSDNASKIKLAKSSNIDIDGQYIAIASGIEPEYIEIYHKITNRRIKKIVTDTNFRYKSFLKFDSGRLYYENINKLSYFDIKKEKNGSIFLYGDIVDIKFDSKGNILTLTNKDGLHYVNAFYPNGKKFFYKEISSDIVNLQVLEDDSFYFKMANVIVRVSIKKS